MFRPNISCDIIKPGPKDIYGHPTDGASSPAMCAITGLGFSSVRTSIRTDAAATRGSARETEAKVQLLFATGVDIALGDIVTVQTKRVRVVNIDPQFSVYGVLDHFQVDCDDWSANG